MAGFVDSLLIAIGLDTKGVAEGVQEVGRTIDSGLKGAFDNAIKGASPLGKALQNLKKDAEDIKEPVDESLKALNELGIRSTEQIQQKIAELQQALDKIQNSTTLTARDKQAAVDEITKKIQNLKLELEKGIPQAAAEGFAGAEAAANRFRSAVSSLWAQISGPLMGAFTIGSTVSSYISNSMSAGELADRLKVDIEEIQIWSGAMDRAGGSASALQGTIEKLNASGKAQGDAIGVLLDLAEKADTMTKEAFYAKARELEIDEKTIEVLAQGKKALEEHLKTQEELGVYTKEDAEQSKKFKQGLADLLQAWDGLTAFIGRFAVPIMKEVARLLAKIVSYMRKHPALIAAAVAMVGAALAYKLMPPLKTLPALIANVGKAFLRWMPWIAVITTLALVFEDFWVYLHGGKSALEKYWKILGDGPELLKKFEKAWENVKKTASDAIEGISNLTKDLYGKMEKHGATGGLAEQFEGNLTLIKGICKKDGKLIAEGLWESIKGTFKLLSGASTAMGEAVVDAVKWAFSLLPSEVTLDELERKLEEDFKNFFKSLGIPSFDELEASFDRLIASLKAKVLKWWNGLFSGLKLPSIFGGGEEKEDIGLAEGAESETRQASATVQEGMGKTADTVQSGFNRAWTATKDFAVVQFTNAAGIIQGIFGGIVSGIETQVGTLVSGAQRMLGGGAMVPAAAGVRAQNAGRSGNVTYNQSNKTNIYAGNGDPAQVQRAAERGQASANRNLVKPSASGTVPKG